MYLIPNPKQRWSVMSQLQAEKLSALTGTKLTAEQQIVK
jgi:hypothetical protein